MSSLLALPVSHNVLILGGLTYKETDKVLTTLSQTHGKLTLVARGALKPASKLAGLTQVLASHTVQLRPAPQGKATTTAGWHTIAEYQPLQHWPVVQSNLASLACGLSWVDWLTLLADEASEAPEQVYALATQTLTSLNTVASQRHAETLVETLLTTLMAGQLSLLALAGAAFSLTSWVDTDEPLPPPQHATEPWVLCMAWGGFVAKPALLKQTAPALGTSCVQLGATTVRVLAALCQGQALPPATNLPSLFKIERLLRFYVEYRTGRRLRSHEFLRDTLLQGVGKT
jgi:recombinational DNA repair protein (RecF pathway)